MFTLMVTRPPMQYLHLTHQPKPSQAIYYTIQQPVFTLLTSFSQPIPTHQLLSTHTNSPASLNPYQLTSFSQPIPTHQPVFTVFYQFTSQCSLYSTKSPASVHCILPTHQPVFTVFYQITSQCSLYSTKSPASVHCILPTHQPVFTVFYQLTSQCSLNVSSILAMTGDSPGRRNDSRKCLRASTR